MCNNGNNWNNSTIKYCKEISKYKNIKKGDLSDIGEKMALIKNGTTLEEVQIGTEAREQLVNSCLRLVTKMAYKYRNCGVEVDDLIQEGTIGLMIAAEKFDFSKGFAFTTYATPWIRKYILKAINQTKKEFLVPTQYQDLSSKYTKCVNDLIQELNREPTISEIADMMDLPEQKVYELKMSMDLLNKQSLDSDDAFFEDLEDPSASVEEVVISDMLKKDIDKLFSTLTEKETIVVRKRMGIDEEKPLSLFKIAKELGITKERVRQLEISGFKKITKYVEENNLEYEDFFY